MNDECKEMEKIILEEVMIRVGDFIDESLDMLIIFIGFKDWYKGLVGLVVSCLIEKFCRFFCVLSMDEKLKIVIGLLCLILSVDIGCVV